MENLILRVIKNSFIRRLLRIISALAVLSSIVTYAVSLVFVFVDSYTDSLLLLAASALSFLLLTLLRLIINAKRPYEIYPSLTVPSGAHKGLSFPSRHVFSIFYIATLSSYVSLFVSVPLFILGVLLAVCRVLLGIHFVRDTLAGALLGVIFSLLTLLLIGSV